MVSYGPFLIRMAWHSAGTYRTGDGRAIFGFGGGRVDTFELHKDIYWGTEEEFLGQTRIDEEAGLALENPLAAIQHGLIYVNPEGPGGRPSPMNSARDMRETFGRMGMDDVETAVLTAGGHSFGKAHGAGDPKLVGKEPEGADIASQGLGWHSTHESGMGDHTITSAWKDRGRRRRSHGT